MFGAIEPIEMEFAAAMSASEARHKTVSVLRERAGRIKIDKDEIVIAGFGSSWKARLFGTVLAGVKACLVRLKSSFSNVIPNDRFRVGTRHLRFWIPARRRG